MGNLDYNKGNSIQREDENDSNNIHIKKHFENIDSDFEKRKIEMIRANLIKKYTFERNTIQKYRFFDGKLVPFENDNNNK